MPKSSPPVILVDGSSYLFRAYHALPPLTNSKGLPTGAVYGVINMLRRLIADYQPVYIGVVFDPKGKTFRHDLYQEYKANRDAMPDELQVQIKPLFDVVKAMGLPLIIEQGVEADDVIGTLAKAASKQGQHVLISTGDKDMAQLVNEQVTLVNTMTDKHMNIDGVKEKFGVTPSQIIDYLTLVGDTSDNIPGVNKVGPKTAAKWLNEYGSIKTIVKNADSIKGKVGEYLREFIDTQLALTQELVTIKTNVDMDCKLASLKPTAADNKKLLSLFTELEFKRWIAEVTETSSAAHREEQAYCGILQKKTFTQWLTKLKEADVIAIDTETTSIEAMEAELVGVSFAVAQGEAAYVPVAHQYPGVPEQLDRDWVLQQLQPILQDKNKKIVGQNLKYDLKVLRHYDIHITAPMEDTLLQSYVLDSTSSRHGIDTLALHYLDHQMIKFEDVAGKGAKQLTFDQVDLEKAVPYAAEDADFALQLYHTFAPMLSAEPSVDAVYRDIDLPLMPILANMEYTGVLIDAQMLKKQSQSLARRLKTVKENVFAISGEEFNIDSPKQLQMIMYEKLKLPILKKTPKGQPSTAEPVMQALALDYPLPKYILEYRSLSKLKSTYTDSLPQQVNPITGRVHTHYNQAVTSTGRLSSNDPNLQNIPIRTEEGKKIRQAFIAPKGKRLVAADYSQIELRIMAHFSKDPGLMHAFQHGLDVHASTAAEIFSIPIEDVTPDHRRKAKAINFGLMYGMSAFGVAQQLGMDRNEAQEHMDVYFSRYPSVHDYMEKARKEAAKKGFVETMFGRRVMVPDINSNNVMRKRAAERAAINAPLQGTAADIIKLAMICIDRWIANSDVDMVMTMQVHDELIFEVGASDLDAAIEGIRHCMEGATTLAVPLIVDMGVGKNWDEAH